MECCMSRWSDRGHVKGTTHNQLREAAPTPRGLASVVGRAFGRLANRATGMGHRAGFFEPLEPRQLLDGSFTNPMLLTPDVNGQASMAGSITAGNNASDNDTFAFD